MKKIILFIGTFLLFSFCTESNIHKDVLCLFVRNCNNEFNDRNGLDYIKLWINDTLMFSGTYQTNFSGSIDSPLKEDAMGMEIANIDKVNKDSIKIKIRLITLDSILFNGKSVVDTTFHYRINNISSLCIDYWRYIHYFRIFDPVKDPNAWIFD